MSDKSILKQYKVVYLRELQLKMKCIFIDLNCKTCFYPNGTYRSYFNVNNVIMKMRLMSGDGSCLYSKY